MIAHLFYLYFISGINCETVAFATFGGTNFIPVTQALLNAQLRRKRDTGIDANNVRVKRENHQAIIQFSMQTSLPNGIIMFALRVSEKMLCFDVKLISS